MELCRLGSTLGALGAQWTLTRKLPAAQFTRMSSRWKRSTACCTHRVVSSGLRTSPCKQGRAVKFARAAQPLQTQHSVLG